MSGAILVTGGVSGIGGAISRYFHDRDRAVIAHYHSSADEARTLRDSGIETIQADLTDPSGVEDLIDTCRSSTETLDLLVNNAACFRKTDVPDPGVTDWNDQMDLNARAPYQLSLLAAKTLLGDGSSIVNVTDGAINRPDTSRLPYSASKAALENLTLGLARALAPDVRVNAVAPGPVDFPDSYAQEQRETIIDDTLLGRSGTKKEVAEAVHFLHARAEYTTGCILPVDGGKHLT